MLPGPRTDVDDPVGSADRLLVVLDHDQGVAQVAEPDQGRDQAGVVPLVEADGRLVEDVEHAHQAGADLGRQPDPLRLATGERAASAVEGQVVEPDVDQEARGGPDLLQDLAGDRVLAVGQPCSAGPRPLERLGHRQPGRLDDVPPADGDRQRLGTEPHPAAGRAGTARHVPLDLESGRLGPGLAVAPLEVRDHALERRREVVARPRARLVPDDDPLPAVAAKDDLARLLAQLRHRVIGREAVLRGDRVEDLREPRVGGRHPAPRNDGTLADRAARVREDEVGVDLEPAAEPGADRAGPVRGVEREVPRRRLLERAAVLRAGVALGVEPIGPVRPLVRQVDEDRPFRQAQRGLDGVRQPGGIRAFAVASSRPPCRTTSRSTTTSIRWRNFLSSAISSSRSRISPDPDPGEPSLPAPAGPSRARPSGPGRPAPG